MIRRSFPGAFLAIVIFATICSASNDDSVHVRNLSAKVKCDCGCGDILSECPHPACKRKLILKQEITDSVLRGGADDRILEQFATRHGAAMLVTPLFTGFSRVLWLVPILVAGIALALLVVYRFRRLERRNGVKACDVNARSQESQTKKPKTGYRTGRLKG
jgi:cytochrome c-type biogenesis protein CcmH/NrfF